MRGFVPTLLLYAFITWTGTLPGEVVTTKYNNNNNNNNNNNTAEVRRITKTAQET
jgi:hypothetical protein